MSVRRAASLAGCVLADGAAICRLASDLPVTVHGAAHPTHWIATVGADRAVAALAGVAVWLVAVWTAAAIVTALAARLPGLPGRFGAVLLRIAVPKMLYPVIAGSAGLGVLLAPVVAATASTAGPAAVATVTPAPTLSPAVSSSTTPSPDTAAPVSSVLPPPRWPTGAPTPSPDTRSSPAPTRRDPTGASPANRPSHAAPDRRVLAPPRWPAGAVGRTASAPPDGTAPDSHPPARPHTGNHADRPPVATPSPARPTAPHPTSETPPRAPRSSANPSPTHPSSTHPSSTPASSTDPSPASRRTGSARSAVVRPGDSLWLIAARRLGATADPQQVADYWPQVYAANRTTVGDDPSLIRSGQVLRLPVPSPHSTGGTR